MANLKEQKVKIDYPCNWQYRVIGYNLESVKSAIDEILCNKDYQIKISNRSKNGKYISVNSTTLVFSEDERVEIFNLLKSHKDIILVI